MAQMPQIKTSVASVPSVAINTLQLRRPNDRPGWRGAEGAEMQTERAILHALQANGYVL